MGSIATPSPRGETQPTSGGTSTGARSWTAGIVGRDHAVATLNAEVRRARTSHGGLVLVTGEAGVGKSTLVSLAADEARNLGTLVVSGVCWDSDSVPGYWPWIQVIRSLRRHLTDAERSAIEAETGDALDRFLGEAGEVTDDADRFSLHDAVTTTLVTVAQRRSLVVVLEDLHWADAASLELLAFVARHTWFEQLLLLGTYRDVEVEFADHPLRPMFAELTTQATSLGLTGLSEGETAELFRRTVGQDPDEGAVAELHRRTGGNPFFIEQIARLWQGGSPLSTIPPGVQAAVRDRLRTMPTSVVDLVTTASVLGRRFHRSVLAEVAGMPVPQTDRLLRSAADVRLVVPGSDGWFAFAHDLVRGALYDAIDADAAQQLHAAVVTATDVAPQLAVHLLPAELANHAYLAGPRVDATRAVDLLLDAGRDARERLSIDEVLRHRRRAYERSTDLSARRRVQITIDLASLLHHLGHRQEAAVARDTAIEVARASGEADLVARVAVWFLEDPEERGARHDRGDLLIEAHRMLFPDVELAVDTPIDVLTTDLVTSIVELARHDNDAERLAFWLSAMHWTLHGANAPRQRAELTLEMEEVARRTGDRELEHLSAADRWVALIQEGDPSYLEHFRDYIARVEEDDQPRFQLYAHIDRGVAATLHGDFAEADRHISAAERLIGADPFVVGSMVGHERWALWLLEGRFDELRGLHARLGDLGHPHPALLAALTDLQRGTTESATRLVAEHGANPTPYATPYAPLWWRLLSHLALATRDADLAARARDLLTPYADGWLVSIFGFEIGGPARLWLGLAAAAQQRWDEAVDHLERAGASADLMQARPWSLLARTHLAEVLTERAGSGDLDRAAALGDEVEAEATALGMSYLVDRVACLRDPDRPTVTTSPTPNEFRFDGQVWSLRFDDLTVHVPDAKGLRDLHLLLGQPGTEIPVTSLLHPAGGEEVVAAASLGGDDVLDERARREYQQRLQELDGTIDEAIAAGADRRAAELDRERAVLLEELRSAAGLAGRQRRLGDAAERARKTVSARVRDVLRKLDVQHPPLAAHLRATIALGANCVYRPDDEVPWAL